ncbi:hypothetical protein GCM10027030_07490 [Luteococcus sediminum]
MLGLDMGQMIGGRHELVDLLGQGGSGAVGRVWDHREGAYRAGKLLQQADAASLVRFVRETGWRVDHPHVVAPLGWVAEDDRVLFTMPLVRGGSLSTVLGDHGPLPVGWALDVAAQLLEALEAVHAAGLVHRDVKPANILMEATGTGPPTIRLGDFGIAVAIDEPRLTRTSQVIGTPGYLPPEALHGADPDPRQDLWAVGAVVLRMLTGERQPYPPRVPEAWRHTTLGRWVGSLLAEVDARPTSATAARARLAAVQIDDLLGTGLVLDEVVEVFDQVPELPAGWGPDGPARPFQPAPSVQPTRSARRDWPDLAEPSHPTEPSRTAGFPVEATIPATTVAPVARVVPRAGANTHPGLLDGIGALPLVLLGLGLLLLALALAL